MATTDPLTVEPDRSTVSPMDLGRFLGIDAAATYAGVGRRTIYNWLKTGRLRAFRVPSGKLRVSVDDLVREEMP